MARNAAFLGTGWAFPPTFVRCDHAVLLSAAETNIRECLWVLLSTALGERLMLPDYGADLGVRVFDALTTSMAGDIRTTLIKAILSWEPRIDVIDITVSELTPLDGRLGIDIDYRVRQTNTRNNLVYPFYLTEATLAVPPP